MGRFIDLRSDWEEPAEEKYFGEYSYDNSMATNREIGKETSYN